MNLKKNISQYIPYVCILFFSTLIIFFGNNDIEDYSTGLFTSKIYSSNISNYFLFFYDFYGPGIRLPIGNGPLFHPLNIFHFNIKIYYFLFFLLHLFIQFFFTKKILNVLNIQFKDHILGLILIFSLPNIHYGLSEDFIAAFFSYCLLPVIFYYLIKIIKKQSLLSYLKISLFFSLWILNGHIGIIMVYVYFLLIYFIFSVKDLNHLKKIFNKNLLICFIFLFLILFEHGYYLISESNKFVSEKYIQGPYSKRPFAEIFLPFKSLLSWTPINRLPGNPIIIYLGLFISIFTLLLKLKEFANINQFKSKNIIKHNFQIFINKISTDINLKLSLIFLIFLFFSLSPLLKYTYLVSGVWVCRDIFLYVGIFLVFNNYNKFKFLNSNIINLLLIIYTVLFLILSINSAYIKKENNFIVNKINKSEFINKLEKLNLNKNDYKRLYLSPGLYPYIQKGFENDGIFANTDLIKYNISPFNGFFKNNSMHFFGDLEHKMSGFISSHFKYINNNFFLDLFKIEYLLITEKELGNLTNVNFKIIDKIKTKKKVSEFEIRRLKERNGVTTNIPKNKNEILYLFKRKFSNFSITENNLNSVKKNMVDCKLSIIDCLLNNENLFKKSKHTLTRESNGKFKIKKLQENEYIYLPFLYDKNWYSLDGKFYNLNNFGILFKKESNFNDKIEYEIEYVENNRKILKIISILSIFILFFSIVYFNIRR